MWNFSLEYFIFAVILVYIPFHLLEEALGDFPLWMHVHGYMPVKKTYGFWMAGNIFFYYPLLMFCALLYHFNNEIFLFSGITVLIWGILNFLEHLFFTLKDRKISPGFYTSVLFLLIGVLGLYKVYQFGNATYITITLSIFGALICAVLPAPLQKYVGNRLWKNFV